MSYEEEKKFPKKLRHTRLRWVLPAKTALVGIKFNPVQFNCGTSLYGLLSLNNHYKGLTDFETTYVDPGGLEPFHVKDVNQNFYICKKQKDDRRATNPRFPSF